VEYPGIHEGSHCPDLQIAEMEATVEIRQRWIQFSRVIPEKLIVAQLAKNFPAFIETKGSLSCSKEPPMVPTLNPANCFSTIQFNINIPPTVTSSKRSVSFWLPDKNFVCISYHYKGVLHTPPISPSLIL